MKAFIKKKGKPGLPFFMTPKRHQIQMTMQSGFRLLHYDFPFVIQFSFMPVGTVKQMRLSSSWTSGHGWRGQ
jgi:hypothetical protein